MRATTTLPIVLLLTLLAGPPSGRAEDEPPPSPELVARSFLGHLARENYDSARAQLDATMTKALAGGKLETIWRGILAKAGPVKSLGESKHRTVGPHEVFDVRCTHEHAVLVLRVAVGPARQVAGFFLMAEEPRVDDPFAVALETPTGTLHGTLDLPPEKKPWAAVLLLAGSGPTDRNGNGAGLTNNHLAWLGRGLAGRGLAVLRYDKRGIGQSAAAGAKEEDLRIETYVDDAVAWVEWLRKEKKFRDVAIAGHSEGALVGMLAAKEVNPRAFVSLAGAGRPAAEVIREQMRSKLTPELEDANDRILERLLAGETVEHVPPALQGLYRTSVQPYLRSWLRYDPATEIATLRCPVLILQGRTDVQVSARDAWRLSDAAPRARLVVLPRVNHVLKHASTQAEQQATYTDPSLPVAPEVVETMVAFFPRDEGPR